MLLFFSVMSSSKAGWSRPYWVRRLAASSADTIAPDVVRIRPPVDWDSAEAIPPALAAVLGGTVVGDETDLHDIVSADADAGATAADGRGPDVRGSDARSTKVHA